MRVAVVGAGLMGRWHAHALRKLGVRVDAIVDTNLLSAERLARSIRGAAAFASLEELFERVPPDVVHICTPVDSHAAIARAALAGGAHVVCEKPLAVNAAVTRDLIEHARRGQRVIRPVHQFATQRGVARAADCLPNLGSLSRISFQIRSAGARDDARRDAVLADIVPHPLSVIAKLWPGVDLGTLDWHVVSGGPGEVDAHCLGASVPISLAISMSGRPTRCAMEVQGSRGSLLVDFFHGFCVQYSGRVSRLRKASYPVVDSARVLATAIGNLALRTWRRELAYPGLEQLFRDVYADIESGRDTAEADAATIAVAQARDEFLRVLASATAPKPPVLRP